MSVKKEGYDQYRFIDTKCIEKVHKSIEPAFRPGDIVVLKTGESAKVVIETHKVENLYNVALVGTFNGKWVGVYYTNVKRTDANGNSVETYEPLKIEVDQRVYKIFEEE